MSVGASNEGADIALVVNQLGRLALLADQGTIEEYVTCFTADAIWRIPAIASTGVAASEVVGREQIAAAAHARRADGLQGPGTATRHIVSGAVVDLDGELARVASYFRFYADTAARPQLVAMGTYADLFRRVDGAWLLADRTIRVG